MIFSQSLGLWQHSGSTPIVNPSLGCIIQQGSRGVQAVQLSSGPCEIEADGGNPSAVFHCLCSTAPTSNIIDCAAGVLLAAMYRGLRRLSLPGSHGEANRGAETAAGEAVPDQQRAAEAEQRPG